MCDKRLASPYFGKNNTLAKWYFGKMILWQNKTLAKWYFGKIIPWQNDFVAKQYFGKIISWDTLAAFQTNTVQSKRFCKLVHEIAAVWMAEEPPIQRFLIFTGKPQQEHHEANGPPRNPNYVLLSLILIYWYDCAVLLAAPRVVQDWLAFYHHGCRDAGTPPCMNMLWSHALPIQVFHVKTVQPSLNLRFFGHENHVSWSFYRFMLCDKRHCLQAWGWHYPWQTSQHHPSISNRSAITQYQCNITKKTIWLKITFTLCNFAQPFKQ